MIKLLSLLLSYPFPILLLLPLPVCIFLWFSNLLVEETKSSVLQNFQHSRFCWLCLHGVIEHTSFSLLFSLSWKVDPEAWFDFEFLQDDFIGSMYIYREVLNVCSLSFCDISNHWWSFLGMHYSQGVQIVNIASLHPLQMQQFASINPKLSPSCSLPLTLGNHKSILHVY